MEPSKKKAASNPWPALLKNRTFTSWGTISGLDRNIDVARLRAAVTEEVWLCHADPRPLLAYLEDRACSRKLRLFAVACWRRIWHLVMRQKARKAIEAVERSADGLGPMPLAFQARCHIRFLFLTNAWDAAIGTIRETGGTEELLSEKMALERCGNGIKVKADVTSGSFELTAKFPDTDDWADWNNVQVVLHEGSKARLDAFAIATKDQANFLRDVFGNPFRPIAIEPCWQTPSVLECAQTIYDDRAFERMPELAHALDEVGCDDPAILEHCRGPGPHVRGCWVIDSVLNKG
jgi:hypothetical protein